MAPWGRKRKARKDDTFQLVQGDNVRRVFFDEYDVHLEEPEQEPEPVEATESRIERVYRPGYNAEIDDIHFEIDHLEMLKAGHTPRRPARSATASAAPPESRRPRTLYTTETGGRVIEAPLPSGGRTLYTSGPNMLSERRFHEKLVDEVVKDVTLDEVIVVEEKVVEYVPKSVAKGEKSKKVKGKSIKTAKKPKKAKVTTDTKPRVKGAEDTAPGKAGQKVLQAQCAALTAAGKQCRNSSRTSSKYCGSHKGYRPNAKKA